MAKIDDHNPVTQHVTDNMLLQKDRTGLSDWVIMWQVIFIY